MHCCMLALQTDTDTAHACMHVGICPRTSPNRASRHAVYCTLNRPSVYTLYIHAPPPTWRAWRRPGAAARCSRHPAGSGTATSARRPSGTAAVAWAGGGWDGWGGGGWQGGMGLGKEAGRIGYRHISSEPFCDCSKCRPSGTAAGAWVGGDWGNGGWSGGMGSGKEASRMRRRPHQARALLGLQQGRCHPRTRSVGLWISTATTAGGGTRHISSAPYRNIWAPEQDCTSKHAGRTSLKSWPYSCIHFSWNSRVLRALKSPTSRSCSSTSAAALPPCSRRGAAILATHYRYLFTTKRHARG